MPKPISPQLPLSLNLSQEATFENFVVGDNALLIQQLHQSFQSPEDVFVYFWGLSGAGCSHLLQAICHHASLNQKSCAYIPLSEKSMLHPDMLEGLEFMDWVCIDDVQLLKDDREWQEALFHLYNRIKSQQGNLYVSAKTIPNNLGLVLPDLVSRLNWGLVFALEGLSESDKIMALQQRALQRGMSLPDDVGRFLINRCQRDTHTLFAMLDTLDKASLAAQRKLTIPFVKIALGV